MKLFLSIAFLLSCPLFSIGQSMFSEISYTEISRGVDPENTYNRYVVVSKHNQDSAYQLKKIFLDSTYTDLAMKSFTKAGITEGPILHFLKGQKLFEGAYKSGKWDGEQKTYRNDKLVLRAFFTDGVKTGVWEYYNEQGQLSRKITHDVSGNVTADVRF